MSNVWLLFGKLLDYMYCLGGLVEDTKLFGRQTVRLLDLFGYYRYHTVATQQ